MGKDTLGKVAEALVIIGGLNIGLVGIVNLDVLKMIFGSIPILLTLVDVLIGLSALYMLAMLFSKK